MPTIITRGAGSAQALGYAAKSTDANFIEDVFSTFLYTGNSSTQTITNGIDLAGEGGLTWIKRRNGVGDHTLTDTIRGPGKEIYTNQTWEQQNYTGTYGVSAFNSTGFSLIGNNAPTNGSGQTYASWTFRKQPKFFDVVTWTGSNDVGTNVGKGIVSHNLGSAPGCVIVKNTTQGSTNWIVYHRSLSGGYRVVLNTTDAQTNAGSSGYFSKYGGAGWVQTDPDANNIYVGFNYQTNGVGDTIVAYLFAHNAGGFGLTGTDNVISCGSYTGNGSSTGPVVTLGYEPQFLLIKAASDTSNWYLIDNMRGMPVGSADSRVFPNTSDAEALSTICSPTATGFQLDTAGAPNGSGVSYIYIAIRRGPMKVPVDATKVFNLSFKDGAVLPTYKGGTVVDLGIQMSRDGDNHMVVDRLRGANRVFANLSNAEDAETDAKFDYMNGFFANIGVTTTKLGYMFRRAPGFFDEVCYTGTGVARTVTHNLAAVPELMIVKCRSTTIGWLVYASALGNTGGVRLDLTSADIGPVTWWNSTTPTSSVFSLGSATGNNSGETFVAYLFATVAGVSKVGSYTGTGTTQVINCGFTAGARFVLIKRTDATGNWYVWDSARGIVAGNDPYLLLNSTAAEVTGTDYVDTASSGFEISSTAPAEINANGGSFIFLAIA